MNSDLILTKSDERSTYHHKNTLDFIGVDPDKTKNKLIIVSFLDTYSIYIIEERRKLNYETFHVKCHGCDGAPCKTFTENWDSKCHLL